MHYGMSQEGNPHLTRINNFKEATAAETPAGGISGDEPPPLPCKGSLKKEYNKEVNEETLRKRWGMGMTPGLE